MGGQSAAQRRAAAQAKADAVKAATGLEEAAGAGSRIEEAALAAEPGAGAPTPRELELARKVEHLELLLAAAREEDEGGEEVVSEAFLAAGPAPETSAVVEALQAVTQTLQAMQASAAESDRASRAAFKEHESPQSVEQSLRGSVTRGEHSGRHADRHVTFRSRGSQFNVVRKARHRFIDGTGEAIVTPGVHYQFETAGDGGGEFITDDLAVIEYLQRRPGFDREFWILGAEPGGAPSAEPMLDAIIDARVNLDIEALDAIEHEERATHGRSQVLQAVAAARRGIRAKADQLAGDVQ